MVLRPRTASAMVAVAAAVFAGAAPAVAEAQSCGGLRALLGQCPKPSPAPSPTLPAPDPGGTEEPDQPIPAPGKRFGFNSALTLSGEATVAQELDAAEAAGANMHRVALPWRLLQPRREDPPIGSRGVAELMDDFYAGALARGITPILITGYAPAWASKYRNCWLLDLECARIARTNRQLVPDTAHLDEYRTFVRAVKARWPAALIQSWNTPNQYWGVAEFPASPQHFAAIQCAAYRGAKAVNDDPVLAAGWANRRFREYVGGVYAAGGASCWDIATVLAYPGTPQLGEGSPLAGTLDAARDLKELYGDDDPLWISETGFTTRGGASVDEATQADGSRRLYNRLVTMDDVGAVLFHTLRDPGDGYPAGSPEYGFGFLRANWSPKPVYCGFVRRSGGTSRLC